MFSTVQRNISACESLSIDGNSDLESGRGIIGWDVYSLRAIDFAKSDGGIDENRYCCRVAVAIGISREVRTNGLGTA